MKNKLFIACSVLLVLVFSCKRKEYVCECTDKKTGEKRYGDTFKGELQRASAQQACDNMVNQFDSTDVCKLITK